MNKTDLFFKETVKKDTRGYNTSEHIQACLFNKCFAKEYELVEKHLELATDTDDFVERILSDDELKHTQGYAVLSKNEQPHQHWYRVREMFGDKQFKTFSDVGGVKIGNDNFSIIIPNGYGDGTTRVAVFHNRKEFNDNMMDFFTSINGEINIYSYDCGNTIERTIVGRYGIYTYEGFVAFVEW